MKRKPCLSFWAGKKAYAKIKDAGLGPGDVDVIAGAAGGPKWLVLNGLDRALFSGWIGSRRRPLFLIGSSIGSWRFAAAAHEDPASVIDRFESAYIGQAYRENPPPEDIDRQLESILDRLMGPGGPEQILSHPFFRISIMAVRCRGPAGSDDKRKLVPAMAAAALSNAVLRRSLGLFFERTLFYDPRDVPPFFDMQGFPIHRVPLTAENIRPALMASGSIPVLMSGIRDIPGAPAGVYRDGGLLDYHLNIALLENGGKGGIVLFPHYAEKIVPGWLDKRVPWRRPDYRLMDDVLMVAPCRDFVNSLPFGKIPDRNDFYRFAGRDAERMAYWRQVVEASRRLADDFMEALETGDIGQWVAPIEELTRPGRRLRDN